VRRRDFLVTAAAVAAGALPARAQSSPTRRLGFSFTLAENDPQTPNYLRPMLASLRAEGWEEGRNLVVDYRWGPNLTLELGTRYARELVALKPDVLIPVGTNNVVATAMATQTIPIVFGLFADPLLGGLVDNLAHPGGNITGFANFDATIGAKWVELLHELAPSIRRVGLLTSLAAAGTSSAWPAVEPAAKAAGLAPTLLVVNTAAEMTAKLAEFAAGGNAGLIVSNDSMILNNRALAYAEVARLHLPTVWGHVIYASEGVMLAFSIDQYAQVGATGGYAGRILNGARVADLPVQLPTKYTMTANLKAAKELGFTIPFTILTRADEVIE
jgi:putative ABC transport system substrate-binding protein